MIRSSVTGVVAAALLLGLGGILSAQEPAAEGKKGAADPEVDNLTRALVEKRGDVDRMSTELQKVKDTYKLDRQGLEVQKTDLKRQNDALQLELDGLEADIARNEAEIRRKQEAKDRVKPMVLRQIDVLEKYVKASLPFRGKDRVAELENLRKMVSSGKVLPERALARLWSSCEDEIRLTRENGIYRQNIEVGGEKLLADVAKIGMVLLYWRALDDRVGMVVPTASGGWEYVKVEDPDSRRRILVLFDALRKHIHEGYFELPNPYAGAARD